MHEVPEGLQRREAPVAVRRGVSRRGDYQSLSALLESTGADPQQASRRNYDAVPAKIVYSALPADAAALQTDGTLPTVRVNLGSWAQRLLRDARDIQDASSPDGTDMVLDTPSRGFAPASASAAPTLPRASTSRTRTAEAGAAPATAARPQLPEVPEPPSNWNGAGLRVRLGEVNRVGSQVPNLSSAWQHSIESYYISK
jgi:hypothetical protein